jgi:hypothetical protein
VAEPRAKGKRKKQTPEELVLKGSNGGSYKYKYVRGEVFIHDINVMSQVRKTFDDLDLLAQDIAQKNLIHDPLVARLTREACEMYISVLNRIWREDNKIDDLTPVVDDGQEVFYILLAGERRLRSCRLIWDVGCEDCRSSYGIEPPGVCFARHEFKDGKIPVKVAKNIPPVAALFIQISENTHKRVPPHEEAEAIARLFQLIKQVDDAYPLATFAKNISKRPETVRNQVSYYDLPTEIRELVEKKIINYGMALVLANLKAQGIEGVELDFWVQRAVNGMYNAASFEKVADEFLKIRNSPQQSLFEIMGANQEAQINKHRTRQIVDPTLNKYLHVGMQYLKKLRHLEAEGKIGREDSPFSSGSPIRNLRALAREFKALIPFLARHVPQAEALEAERNTDELIMITMKIEPKDED